MSIGNVYVKAVDTKWYAEPAHRGVTEKGNNWFVCYDEDDPPELVIETTHGPEDPGQILKAAGFKTGSLSKGTTGGRRCFGDWMNFLPAQAYDLTLLARPPIPTGHKGVFDCEERLPGMNSTSIDYDYIPKRRPYWQNRKLKPLKGGKQ